MANDTLDSLGISITADTKAGVDAITNLIRALERLEKKTRVGGDFGLGRLAESLRTFGQSIREYTRDVEAYGNLLSMMGVKASDASRKVSSGMKSAAKDTKTATDSMKEHVSGVGDSIKIVSKEAVDLAAKLRNSDFGKFMSSEVPMLPAHGAQNAPLLPAHNVIYNPADMREAFMSMKGPETDIFSGNSIKLKNLFDEGIASVVRYKGEVMSVGDAMRAAFSDVSRHAKPVVSYSKEILAAWKGIAQGVAEVAKDIAKIVKKVVEIAKKIGGAIKSVIKTLQKVFSKIGSIISSITKRIASALRGIFAAAKKIATPIAKFLGAGAKNLINSVKKIFEIGKGLLRRIGRISLYRIVREVLAKAFDNIYEGFENLYYWASIVGYKFSDAMNRIASASLLVRNAFAAMVEPLVTSVYPIVERLAARFAEIAAIVAKFLAELLGRDTYVVAKAFSVTYKDSLDDVASGANGAAAAVEKYKNTLMGFDELNPLNDINERNPSGGSGGGGSGYSAADYAQMFETRATDLGSWASKIGDLIRNAKWEDLGKALGEKINDVVDNIKWADIGAKVGNWINGLFTTEYWTLKTTNFENIGSKIAEFLNEAIKKIDFTTVGETMALKLTAIGDLIIGFFRDLEWEDVGGAIHDFLVGYATEWTEWLSEKDWGQITSEMKENLINFFKGLNISDITSSFAELGSAIFNAIKSGFPSSITTWVDNNIIYHIKAALNGDTTWTEAGSKIWQNIKASLKSETGIGAWVKEHLVDPIGSALIGESNWQKVQSFFSNLPDKIKSWISTAPEKIIALGELIGEGIASGVSNYFKEHPINIKELIFGKTQTLDQYNQSVIDGTTGATPTLTVNIDPKVSESDGKAFWENLVTILNITRPSALTWGNGVGVGAGTGIGLPVTANITDINDDLPESQKTLSDFAASIKKKYNDMKTDAYGVYGWLDYGSDITTKYNSLSTDNYGAYGWLSYGANMTQTYNGMSKDNYGVFGWLAYGATLATKYIGLSKDSYGVYGWLSYGADMIKKYISLKKDSYGVYAWLSVGASIKKLWNAITSMWVTKAGGGIFYGGQWHNVASYAQGGSPLSGQMFIAREAGPELVGTLGGHTAVMNNDQIVASVSAGVARAISNIEFHMNGAFGTPVYGAGFDEDAMYRAFLRALNDSDIGDINLDGDVLYRKMVNRNNHNTRMTGVNAFA